MIVKSIIPPSSSQSVCGNFKYIRALLSRANSETITTEMTQWGWIAQGFVASARRSAIDTMIASRFRDGMKANDMVNEDKESDKQAYERNFESFGPNAQPVLDKVEFRVTTPFYHDFRENSREQQRPEGHMETDATFKCLVKFEGSRVIDGIKALPENGLAHAPLPSFLADLHSSAKNKFTITIQGDN